MSFPQRLPIVNSDDGTWGDILLQYLELQHVQIGGPTGDPTNGGHQNVTISAGTTTAAPLTFASGPNLTSAAAGSMEFLNDILSFTITTGAVRKNIAMFDDSAGASGDMYYRSTGGVGTGNLLRVGIGTTGQSLRVIGGVPAWSNDNNGFKVGSPVTGATYTIGSTDTVILVNAASNNVAVSLPQASGLGGYRFYIKRIDSSYPTNSCTLSAFSGDSIDGASSQVLHVQYTSLAVVSDGGTNWYIL